MTVAPIGAILRDVGAAAKRRQRGPSRMALRTLQARASTAPRWQAQRFRLYRERCPVTRCRSRYAVARVTRDYTSAASIETFAHLECALCGHVIRAVRPPRVASATGEDQRTRLSLILPGDQSRWYARGRWHTQGEDAVVLTDASLADVLTAQAEWRVRADRLYDAKARVKARKEAADAAAHEATVALLARLAAKDAARAAEEAAAAAREA